jgi:hypothetical protein
MPVEKMDVSQLIFENTPEGNKIEIIKEYSIEKNI